MSALVVIASVDALGDGSAMTKNNTRQGALDFRGIVASLCQISRSSQFNDRDALMRIKSSDAHQRSLSSTKAIASYRRD
jgi:hypothetical protein